MITLAVLYWLAKKIGGKVGEQWFYETLPVDEDGNLVGNGVFGVTVQAPRGQADDYHTYISFYVVAGENYTDDDGTPIPDKQATDMIADKIEDAVSDALDDPSAWELTVPTTQERFYDVRMTTSTGKNTLPMLNNGAIVKSLEIEVWYKKY